MNRVKERRKTLEIEADIDVDVEPEAPEQIANTYTLLPTGKPHISFSELRSWKDCSWRHMLEQVKKVDMSKPSVILDFGTSVHAAHEAFMNTGTMDVDIAIRMLREFWKEHEHNESIVQFEKGASDVLQEVPAYYNATFPNWKPVGAEHMLYESIEGHPHAFKGYIDAIIEADGPRNKRLYWIIDAKTTTWGWSMEKKRNEMVKNQLVLYKAFWSKKMNVDPKNVRCGFLLLKRTAKPGSRCELVTVSVGDKSIEKARKHVSNMLVTVKRGIAIKNRYSCTYCQYKGTEHCT